MIMFLIGWSSNDTNVLLEGVTERFTGFTNFWKSGLTRRRQTSPDFCQYVSEIQCLLFLQQHHIAGVRKSIGMRALEIGLETFSFHA
jgi:hypothetical protein